jgi:hypothetical protein
MAGTEGTAVDGVPSFSTLTMTKARDGGYYVQSFVAPTRHDPLSGGFSEIVYAGDLDACVGYVARHIAKGSL